MILTLSEWRFSAQVSLFAEKPQKFHVFVNLLIYCLLYRQPHKSMCVKKHYSATYGSKTIGLAIERGPVSRAKPAVLTAGTDISGMKTQHKNKRMLNRYSQTACLFNIRYTSDFYFTENSVHKFCKEFSVTSTPIRHRAARRQPRRTDWDEWRAGWPWPV